MTEDSEDSKEDGYLTGQLLVAMPQMLDERFAKSVIYLCAHTEDGAMGLVVNKLLENIDFPDLLDQLDLSPAPGGDDIRVHFGDRSNPAAASCCTHRITSRTRQW